MCDNHAMRDLVEILGDDWESNLLPIRCLPPLGVHEWCEHDTEHPPPSFRNQREVR